MDPEPARSPSPDRGRTAYPPLPSESSSTRPLNRPYSSSWSSDYEASNVSAASHPASYMSREEEASVYASFEPPPSLAPRERRLSLQSVLEGDGVLLRDVASGFGYQLTPLAVTEEGRTARPLPEPVAHSADVDHVDAQNALASDLGILANNSDMQER